MASRYVSFLKTVFTSYPSFRFLMYQSIRHFCSILPLSPFQFIYIIGTDHAGIATQLQVEKALIAEGKKD